MSKSCTFQYTKTTSINRDNFLNVVVRNKNLSKKELRVLLHLLTHLDSLSYKEISKKSIADDLCLSKSEVQDAIDELIYFEVIEEGSSQSVSNGYKLLF